MTKYLLSDSFSALDVVVTFSMCQHGEKVRSKEFLYIVERTAMKHALHSWCLRAGLLFLRRGPPLERDTMIYVAFHVTTVHVPQALNR